MVDKGKASKETTGRDPGNLEPSSSTTKQDKRKGDIPVGQHIIGMRDRKWMDPLATIADYPVTIPFIQLIDMAPGVR